MHVILFTVSEVVSCYQSAICGGEFWTLPNPAGVIAVDNGTPSGSKGVGDPPFPVAVSSRR